MNQKITKHQRTIIYLLWLRGWSLQQIGDRYHVRKATIWYIINYIITGRYKEGEHYEKLSEISTSDID